MGMVEWAIFSELFLCGDSLPGQAATPPGVARDHRLDFLGAGVEDWGGSAGFQNKRGNGMKDYSTSIKLRIDWSEIDSFGHINNLAIMKYVQTARVQYLEEIGMMPLHAETGVGPVLASTSCQFKKQLYYPGNVEVFSTIDHIKNTSFQMRHAVINDAKELIAEAHDVLVMFNFNKNTKLPIPGIYREKIEERQSRKIE